MRLQFLLPILLTIATGSVPGADPAPPDKVAPGAPVEAQPFDLTQVRLLDGPFRDAMLRDKALLLGMDADRLLHNFRVTAGLPSQAKPLGGWEAPKCELRGHFVGHYLSACSLMYASTGDEPLKQRVDTMVAELAKCQEAMPAQRLRQGVSLRVSRSPCLIAWTPASRSGRLITRCTKSWPACSMRTSYCGNCQALDVLDQMADWLDGRVSRLSFDQMQIALRNEHGGMNEVLANLYAVTGNAEYLKLAGRFNHEAVFAPLAAGQDKLDGLHANTQIPKMIGAARQYELSGDKRLHDVAAFFWDRVALHRSWVIGGHSDNEHFFPITDFARHLSPRHRGNVQHLQHAQAHAAHLRVERLAAGHRFLRAGALQPHPRLAGP